MHKLLLLFWLSLIWRSEVSITHIGPHGTMGSCPFAHDYSTVLPCRLWLVSISLVAALSILCGRVAAYMSLFPWVDE
jgi:hypothetical protein